LTEVYTTSLVPEDPDAAAIRLPTPLTADQAVLRTTLVSGLVEGARRNAAAGSDDIALFEIGHVYLPPADPRPTERTHVGAIVSGGFARAKGILEILYDALAVERTFEPTQESFLHPGKAARTGEGWLGELHPAKFPGAWGVFEVELEALLERVPGRVVYQDVITYPPVRQDLAFAVPEDVTAGELVSAAAAAAGPALREMRAFDVYRGDQVGAGKKSIAFSVAFQSPERTLTDEDAAELRNSIVKALGERFGAQLRA
jgi:phenylalanyl-tRNA synthetase beta chain